MSKLKLKQCSSHRLMCTVSQDLTGCSLHPPAGGIGNNSEGLVVHLAQKDWPQRWDL